MPESLVHPALSSKLHVVGIDPALRCIGLGRVINGRLRAKLLKTNTDIGTPEKNSARLVEIFESILDWIDTGPALIVIEGYSYNSTEGRFFQLGEAGGVIRLACAKMGIEHVEVPPSSLKLFVAGNGSASKATMMKAVAENYGYETEDDNVGDAVGLTMWGLVTLTGKSVRRCELQAIRNLSREKKKADAVRFKVNPGISV